MTSQERRFVPQIPHSQLLQSAHTLTGRSGFASGLASPSGFLLHGWGEARHGHLGDVGDNDEGSGKGAFVTGFCAFDRFGSEDDVETGGGGGEDIGKRLTGLGW
jgi:hypothetical protein